MISHVYADQNTLGSAVTYRRWDGESREVSSAESDAGVSSCYSAANNSKRVTNQSRVFLVVQSQSTMGSKSTVSPICDDVGW
jgi:hypothetical protein